jgi:release factor glutamine methyltransferase
MARLDAQRLLLAALGGHPHDRAWLLAHDTDAVPPAAAEQFRTLCERLRDGEPVAYLLGRQDFYGLTLQVDARVLIPRPDTETLVTWAIEQLQPAACMLDLGTGSGAIALAVRKARPDVDVEAVDASEAALAVARANAARLSLDVRFRQACWLAGAGHYDVIVSNPPYVAEGDPHLAGLLHEPRAALVAGPHGLADLSHIAAAAPRHLTRGGWLLLEHGWDQAAAVRQLLVENGFTRVSSRCDLAGIERCSGGQWLELG